MEKDIIFGIQFETEKGRKNLDKLTLEIAKNKKELAANRKELKNLDPAKETDRKRSEQLARNINELTGSNKNLTLAQREQVKALNSAGNSIEAQRNRLSVLTKQYDKLDPASKKAENLKNQINSLTKTVSKGEEGTDRYGRSVGKYKENVSEALRESGLFSKEFATLEKLQRIAGTSTDKYNNSLKTNKTVTGQAVKSTNTFSFALKAIPIILIIGAFVSLARVFLGTQKGMDALSKVTRPLKALFQGLIGVIQDLSFKAFDGLGKAIDNPIQAFKDLGQAIVDNVINRFKAISVFTKAVSLLFEGEYKAALKTATDSAIQLATGVTNATEKIQDFGSKVKEEIKTSLDAGSDIDRLTKELEKLQITSAVPIAKARLEYERLREVAQNQLNTDKERITALQDAEKQLFKINKFEEGILSKKIQIKQLEQSLNDTTREEQLELENLKADLLVKQTANQKKLNTLVAQRSAIEKRDIEETAPIRDKIEEEEALLRQQIEKESELNKQAALSKQLTEEELAAKLVEIEETKQQDLRDIRLESIDQELEDLILKNDLTIEEQQRKIDLEVEQEKIKTENLKSLNNTQLENKKATEKASQDLEKQSLNSAQSITKGLQSLFKDNTEASKSAFLAEKGIAFAENIIQTQAANAKAVAASPLTGGQPFVTLNTISGVVRGATIAATAVQGFNTGGVVTGGTPIQRSNGDNVLITARTGEVVLNEKQQEALGGARTFSSIGVPGFNTGGLVGSPKFFDSTSTVSRVQNIQDSVTNSQLIEALQTQKVVQVVSDFTDVQDTDTIAQNGLGA